MIYNRLKILNQFLEKGLSAKTNWGTINPKGSGNRITDYDEALYLLGFHKYIKEVLKPTKSFDNIELHFLYLSIIKEYIGTDGLNRYEQTLVAENEDKVEKAVKLLESSPRFKVDRGYYQSRIPLTKKEFSGTLMVTKRFVNNILGEKTKVKLNPIKGYKNPYEEKEVEIGRIKPNGDLIVGGYDERAFTMYNTRPNIPYSRNIHPYLYSKLAHYMPEITKKPITIFSAFENPQARDFEVILLAYLEMLLTKDVDTVRETLEPTIELGHIISNRVCIAYAVPEVEGDLEYFKVVFNYGEGLTILTDRERLKRITDLRGLFFREPLEERDPNDSPLLRDTRISVWDTIFMGAYRPKNRNENDIRGGNIMK